MLNIFLNIIAFSGRSMITKKGEGSQVKESTDSSNTTLEDDDVKGKYLIIIIVINSYMCLTV